MARRKKKKHQVRRRNGRMVTTGGITYDEDQVKEDIRFDNEMIRAVASYAKQTHRDSAVIAKSIIRSLKSNFVSHSWDK